ncbi:MAG: hypothetical protein K0R00_947 [Herbinix sp.]|jgi:hypothetical protein|nr:hypothetical protein [Herbinix sp.]
MSDDNFQDFQNPDNNLSGDIPPSPELTPTEETYWESNSSESSDLISDEPANQTADSGDAPQSVPFVFSNPTQQFESNSTNFPQPEKSGFRKIVPLVVIVAILLVGAVTAFAFKDTLMNTVAKATKSPAEYYAYVEKNAINETLDEFIPILKESEAQSKKSFALDTKTEIKINEASLDTLLQKYLGLSLVDVESSLGISLESIGIDALVGKDDKYLNENFTLSLNQIDLISAEIIMNNAMDDIFVRFPELSSDYLNISTEKLAGEDLKTPEYSEIMDTFTADFVEQLVKKYSSLILDNISQTTLSNNETLSLETLSTDATLLTVTITDEDAKKILTSLLKAAKIDKDFISIASIYGLEEEDYQDYIDDSLDVLEDEDNTILYDDLEMQVYVDSKGKVIGRTFSVEGESDVIGYTYLEDSDYSEYEVFVKDDEIDYLVLSGSQTVKNDAYTGSASATVSTGEYGAPVSVDISYDDLKTVKKNNYAYQYGSINISSIDLFGAQLLINFDEKDNHQLSEIVVQMGAEPLVTLTTVSEYLNNYEASVPAEGATIYDINDVDSYSSTIDIEAFITSLSDKLGIDVQSLINSFYYY